MRSIRFKIILPFLLGSLLLTVFLSWYTYTSAKKAVADSVLLIAKAQTSTICNSMSLLFRSMTTSAEKMTTDPHVIHLFDSGARAGNESETGTDDWFEILIQGNEYYRGIFIVDKDGTCIASNSQMQIGISYAARPYVQTALGGELVISEVSVGQMTKNLSATVATPIYKDGDIVGAVIMVNDFPDLVHYDEPPADGIQAVFSAIIAPDGSFITHRDNALTAGDERHHQLYTRLAAAGNGAAVNYTLNDEPCIGYAALEPTTGWVIISSGLNGEIFSHANSLSIVVFLVSLTALCLTSFGVVRVVNGILDSLLSLITYAKKVSEGDLTLKLENSTRSDELGVLHRALQALVQSMKEILARSQEASKLKSEFLANMSHEIRTPLNAVIGMAHLYLADDAVTEKKRGYITKIQVAGKTLLGIINNILDISKIEAGMFELDSIPFNLRETIEQILVIHQETAAAKGLELSVSYALTAPQSFIGDPVRIGQVLNNLTGNAIKFSDHGSVGISCDLAAPADDEGLALMRVSVTDTGLGISPDHLKTLFTPFTQADASITRRFGGTGLGLAISAKIVHLLGGEFTVESTPSVGTRFSFTMRLCANEEEHAANDCQEPDLNQALSQLRLHGKRILVAEDNDINQLIMKEMLRPTGAEVVMAANGLLAVNAVKEQHFDLVFMDMQMPVMDGIQATREIRSVSGYDSLPIVAVTANAMKEDKDNGFDVGLNDYITKPIEPRYLIMALRKWL